MSDFSFHAGGPVAKPGTTRLLHFCFYLGALLLLVAGVHALYLYFTAWSTVGDTAHLWQLVLGIVYLLVSGLVAYATYNHSHPRGGEPAVDAERFAEVKGGRLTYELDQIAGRQSVALDQVAKAEKPSVRELVLTLKDGTRQVIPVYLIDDDAKRQELERLLLVG